MRAFMVGCIIALVLAGAVTALTYDESGRFDTAAAQDTLTDTDVDDIPSGEALLTGQARALSIEGYISVEGAPEDENPVLPGPLTFDADERGLGGNGADIVDVMIDGEPGLISWDTGRPLQLEGPGLALDRAVFVFGENGVRLDFGESFQALVPGEYTVNTPVAVTVGNQSLPRDSVSFTAGEESGISFYGSVFSARPEPAFRYRGPGQVGGEGDFTITTRTSERDLTRFVLGPDDAFLVEIEPGEDPQAPPWTIRARLRRLNGELLTDTAA